MDDEGRHQILMEKISDHRFNDEVVPIGEGTDENSTDEIRLIKITKGWKVYIIWKYITSNWVALEDLKEFPLLRYQIILSSRVSKINHCLNDGCHML